MSRDLRAAEVEALAAREDGLGDLVRLGGGEHEDDVGRRLLERLEQRVEGLAREHVDLVDDVDLEAAVDRREGDLVAQVADVVDAAVGGGVHLDDVERTCRRRWPRSGGRRRRAWPSAASPARPASDAVERLGEDARGARLAGAARAGEEVGVGDRRRSRRRCAGCARRGPARRARRRSAGGTCGRGSASSDGRSRTLGRRRRGREAAAHPPSKRVLRASSPGASSGQATPRHMEGPAYRCFLPDLTGFAGFHCVGPGLQRRTPADSLAERPLGRGFSPAVADCGYRAPLAPRLARPGSDAYAGARGGEANVAAGAARRARLARRCRPGPATLRRVGTQARYLLAALVVALVVLRWSWSASRRSGAPRPLPAERRPGSSRPARAMDAAARVAAEPRPIGSPAPARRRATSSSRTSSELALAPHVQTADVGVAREPRVAGMVHNVVARLPGPRPLARRPARRALRLRARGRRRRRRRQRRRRAARDGARPALRARAAQRRHLPVHRRGGARPARARRRSCATIPGPTRVGVVLNFDSPGSSSPALMYETSPGNGLLVASSSPPRRALHARRSCTRSRGASRSVSDFRPFVAARHPGDELRRCWTARPSTTPPTTRSRAFDAAGLQHEGDTALALARRFGDARPVAPPPRRTSSTSTSSAASPSSTRERWSLPFVALAVALFVVAVAVAAPPPAAHACAASAWAVLGDRRHARRVAAGRRRSSGRCTAPPTRSASGRAPAS